MKNPQKADKLIGEAHVADKMANTAKVDAALAKVGSENAVRFLLIVLIILRLAATRKRK